MRILSEVVGASMQQTSPARPFAVVTGASRGIGAEYARALAVRGFDLLLVSRDSTQLEQMAAELGQQYPVSVTWEAIDLAEPEAAHKLYATARQRRDTVDLLVNNAGFGLYGKFVDMPMARLQEMLRLHVNTVIESIRLFLPDMLQKGRGAIINVASLVGLFPLPYLAQYAATKALLVSFSEALAEEVRHSGVRIQACCPGSTETDFHAIAGHAPKDPIRSDSPAEVVAASLAALEKGPTVVTVGRRGRLYASLIRWVPRRIFMRAVAAAMKPRAR